jgi:SAM-dependent methyltransferase
MGFKKQMPWWMRITAKIVLARLPIDYSFWKRLGLFEHGDMNQPERALETYLMHARTGGLGALSLRKGLTVLELGPGDSLFTALIAKANGASHVYLVDVGPFATTDLAAYVAMAEYLESQNYKLPFAPQFTDFQNVLIACNADYLTQGVASLAKVPSHSVDFCFSNAVLEHIPKGDFLYLVSELKRLLKSDGVCVHRVDLKDHLGGGLNNLRFSEVVWEGPLFSRSGFYTNRIRYAEMLNMFERAGFSCEVTRKITWDNLPIVRSALSAEFKSLPDANLLVSGFDVVLRPLCKNNDGGFDGS